MPWDSTKNLKENDAEQYITQLWGELIEGVQDYVADQGKRVLYGPDNNPISVVNNKLAVRVTELENLLGEVQEEPSENTLLARIKSLETKIQNIIDDGLNVQQTGSIVSILTKHIDEIPGDHGGVHFGENIDNSASSVQHVDTSMYTKKSFIVRNNLDSEITVRFFIADKKTNFNFQEYILEEKLAAAAEKWYRYDDYPQLIGNHLYSRVTLLVPGESNYNEGALSVIMFGGN